MKSFAKACEICIFLDVSIHYFTFHICSEFRLYVKCNHVEYGQYQTSTSGKIEDRVSHIIFLFFFNQQKLLLEYFHTKKLCLYSNLS